MIFITTITAIKNPLPTGERCRKTPTLFAKLNQPFAQQADQRFPHSHRLIPNSLAHFNKYTCPITTFVPTLSKKRTCRFEYHSLTLKCKVLSS